MGEVSQIWRFSKKFKKVRGDDIKKKYCRAAGAKKMKPNVLWYTPVVCFGIRYADDTNVELAYEFICFVYLSQTWLKFIYDGFTPVVCLNGWFILCLRGSFFTDFVFAELLQMGFVKELIYRYQRYTKFSIPNIYHILSKFT